MGGAQPSVWEALFSSTWASEQLSLAYGFINSSSCLPSATCHTPCSALEEAEKSLLSGVQAPERRISRDERTTHVSWRWVLRKAPQCKHRVGGMSFMAQESLRPSPLGVDPKAVRSGCEDVWGRALEAVGSVLKGLVFRCAGNSEVTGLG